MKRLKKLSAERLFTHTSRGGVEIVCRHLRKKRIKNLYIRVDSDGVVEVSTPWRFGQKDAALFVSEKEEWILKRILHNKSHGRINPKSFFPGCEAWYLGKKYPVEYKESKKSVVDFKNGLFLFRGEREECFEAAIERFYLRSAKKVLPERIEFWSEKMNLFPSKVNFRRLKSRWGSCSAADAVTLNSALMRYDTRLIDYVIIHELAHIKYKHHRKEFWSLVERFEPDYRSLGKMLV